MRAVRVAAAAAWLCALPMAAPAQAGPRVRIPAAEPRPNARPAARDAFAACALAEPDCAPPPMPREFRGVWVATVDNIDWPSRPGLSTARQKRELLAILDRAQASGLNAVVFQVRPAGDALYRSTLEPWSEYLTGRQGRAPFPRWDPLAFAVEEAHRRGLELHAWFNPYRARHPSAKGREASTHLSRVRPALVKRYGTHLWMDPGEPDVRAHTVRVILDVVRRYDIDAVHFDDYFYPYKERDRRGVIDFPDSASYARYVVGGGTLARDDWRRENVDLLVEELSRTIHGTKPWVKFGVSPFGIWRPGHPEQVRGFDAYAELYADARKWVREGWVDYFAPQLYWPVSAQGQPYDALLRWWAEQNVHGRNLWPGNFTSRVGERSRTAWRTDEVARQLDLTRAEAGASGNIHFSAKVFLEDRDSLATRLGATAYEGPALVPASPWLEVEPAPAARMRVTRRGRGSWTVHLAPAAGAAPRWWVVQWRADGKWRARVVRGKAKEVELRGAVDRVAVRGVDGAGVEGEVVVWRARSER